MVFTILENALDIDISTHAPIPHSKLQAKYFENLFPSQQKRVDKTMICFIKIQSENMKMTWKIRLFIFGMVCNFSKCDGFIVM